MRRLIWAFVVRICPEGTFSHGVSHSLEPLKYFYLQGFSILYDILVIRKTGLHLRENCLLSFSIQSWPCAERVFYLCILSEVSYVDHFSRSVSKRTFGHVRPAVSNQPAYSRSLIRIFTGRILDSQECERFFRRPAKTDQTARIAQADLGLRWEHMSECTLSHVQVHLFALYVSPDIWFSEQQNVSVNGNICQK